MPHDERSGAVALQDRRLVGGIEAVIVRLSGARAPFTRYPPLLTGMSGHLIGAINLPADISAQERGN